MTPTDPTPTRDPQTSARPVPTGCVHVCALDVEGWCTGCHRHQDAICRWPGALR